MSLLDITDRRALEQQQRRLAQERAELLRVKDEFFATLSHELRTPLTSIVGWAALIKSGIASPKRLAEGIAAVERNARIQSRLIEELLDVSRMSAGKVQFEAAPVNVSELVKQVVESMQPTFVEKGLRLEMNVCADIPPVSGDHDRLQQVLMSPVELAQVHAQGRLCWR